MSNTLLKYFPSERVPIKVIGPSADGNFTRVEVLVTPFGSKKKKDLHGEFFDAKSYFGDDTITRKYGLYEHFMNDWNNPVMSEMGKQKQIMGPATLTKTDEAGRWFEFEIKRSLEYHDALMNMIDLKIMGASTQCLPNSKVRDDDGYISMWVESEVSLTPTPANKDTIGRVYELIGAKSAEMHLPKLQFVKNGQLLDFDPANPAAVLEETPASTPEPEPEPETAPDLLDQINDLLGTGEGDTAPTEPVVAASDAFTDEVQKSISRLVAAEVKAQMSVFIELWGSDVNEAREAILSMMGNGKMTADGMTDMMNRMSKMEQGLLAFAKFFKDSAAAGLKQQVTPQEKDLLDTTPAPKTNAPRFKSAVPEPLRVVGGNK